MGEEFESLKVELKKLNEYIIKKLSDLEGDEGVEFRSYAFNALKKLNPGKTDYSSSALVKRGGKITPLGCTPGKCYD